MAVKAAAFNHFIFALVANLFHFIDQLARLEWVELRDKVVVNKLLIIKCDNVAQFNIGLIRFARVLLPCSSPVLFEIHFVHIINNRVTKKLFVTLIAYVQLADKTAVKFVVWIGALECPQ